jgi:uncharacterized protein YndB with AHSA1/START domain
VPNPLKILKLKPAHFQFIQELKIDAPPKRVWAAILDVGGWFRFGPGKEDKTKRKLEPWVGGRFIAEDPSDGSSSLHTVVTYIEPGKLLRMTGPMGMSHVPAHNVFIFELQPRGTGTLLRFCQRTFGYLTANVSRDYQGGWKQLFAQLKTLAEKRSTRKR